MFGGSRTRDRDHSETSQPLLDRSENDDRLDRETVFSIDDDEDYEAQLPEQPDVKDGQDTGNGHVRFQDHIDVIAPSLRSNVQSRETEYELDSDEFDDMELPRSQRGSSPRDGPLLTGLLESSSRRIADGSIPMHYQSSEDVDDSDPNLEDLAAKRLSGGAILASVANMANSILGAGIIGLPYAVSQAGFFTGIILLVALSAVTDWTVRLIVLNAKLSGRKSYIDIMDHCFGASGRAAVSFFQFSFAFGGMCAFGIIIGDTIPHVIRSAAPQLMNTPVLWLLTNRQFIITLCTVCVSYPLSLYRDIHKLARASGLALIGMTVIVIAVLVESPHVESELRGDPSKRWSIVGPGPFQAIGVISFAFVCHHNSLLIYGSLRTPTLDRFTTVTHISTMLSLVACLILAIAGFTTFVEKTQGNVLNNFPSENTVINVARICFGLNMFTTLPLELFACREVIEQFFFSHEAFNLHRHVFFTTVILFASMMLALITCDLGVMLEITGGISATALAFIFPAACYIKLVDSKAALISRKKLPAVICVGFGTFVMVISLVLALRKMGSKAGDVKMCN